MDRDRGASLRSPQSLQCCAGRENIDRDVIITNGLALEQTSSSTSDWMLK